LQLPPSPSAQLLHNVDLVRRNLNAELEVSTIVGPSRA